MIRKTSIPGIVISFVAMVSVICLGARVAGAQERQTDLESNFVASHLLDGKKFIFTNMSCRSVSP